MFNILNTFKILFFSGLVISAKPGLTVHTNRMPCDAALMEEFKNPYANALSQDGVKAKYTHTKTLSGGASGASVNLVVDKSNNQQRIFKVLPEDSFVGEKEDNIAKMHIYREAYLTCKLAQLSPSSDLPGLSPSLFFPTYFESGFINARDVFSTNTQITKSPLVFIVMEAINGTSLTEFNLDTLSNKELAGILYQIFLALKIANQQIDFVHNDLHTGNILISQLRFNTTVIHNGKILAINAPLVKIIDFGLGKSTQSPSSKKSATDIWIAKRPTILELDKFIGKVNSDFSKKLRTKIYSSTPHQDLHMVNLILHSLAEKLRQRNMLTAAEELPICENYQACLDVIARWL